MKRGGPVLSWAYETKAIVTLCVLEVAILTSIATVSVALLEIRLSEVSNRSLVGLSLVLLVYVPNHVLLLRKDGWRQYDTIIDNLPSHQRRRGGVISACVTVSVVFAYISTIYVVGAIRGTW